MMVIANELFNILYKLFICLLMIIVSIYICIYNLLFESIFDNDNDNDNENTYYNNNNICPICFENKINICCIPCGHTYCKKCIECSNNCFICRSNINKIIKIYI